jgi:splicing factor 3A subunit 3
LRIDDYLSFLSYFDQFDRIPISLKKATNYKEYIRSILDYLKRFFIKTHPLCDMNAIQDTIDNDFFASWDDGTVPGYQQILNKIRENEDKSSLYCLACQKLFTNEYVYEHHKQGKNHIKNVAKNSDKIEINNLNLSLNEISTKEEEDLRELAYFEFQIVRFKSLLYDIFENTKNLIRKKQSMNLEEIENDVMVDGELDQIEFNDEDEKKVYNPKNVPLGWDGK